MKFGVRKLESCGYQMVLPALA